MKTFLIWVLGFIIVYLIMIIVVIIVSLYDGSMVWNDGWFRAVDENGQIIQPKPFVKPSQEEIKQIEAEHQGYRSNKAAWLCFGGLGAFILGWITGQTQFKTLGLCCLVGAFVWDYKTCLTALFAYHLIVPSLIVLGIAGIIGFFRKS